MQPIKLRKYISANRLDSRFETFPSNSPACGSQQLPEVRCHAQRALVVFFFHSTKYYTIDDMSFVMCDVYDTDVIRCNMRNWKHALNFFMDFFIFFFSPELICDIMSNVYIYLFLKQTKIAHPRPCTIPNANISRVSQFFATFL